MTRSMQPTIAAVDRIAQAAASTERLAYSYRRGYEDGLSHGTQAAYRRIGYLTAALVAVGVLVAWML